jgi:crotonobetaine/carnitine-CoA ligase
MTAACRIPGHLSYELEMRAEDRPDYEVISFVNELSLEHALTYQSIVIQGRKIASELLERGFRKGDCFAVLMHNEPVLVYCLYAAALTGTIMVPLNPKAKREQLLYMLSDSNSKGLVVSSECITSLYADLKLLSDIMVIGVVYREGMHASADSEFPALNEILEGPERPPPDNPSKELISPLEIIYTGSKNKSLKGAIIKGLHLYQLRLYAKILNFNKKDKLYTGLSLSHGNAQAFTLAPSLLLGIPSVISRKFTRNYAWDICRKFQCTVFSLLGDMMMEIYSEPPKVIDAIHPVQVVIGSGFPIAILREFEKRFNVLLHELYGSIEYGFAHKPPGIGPIGSFGKPFKTLMDLKVVGGNGKDCESYERGEIVVRKVGEDSEVEYVGEKLKGWLRTNDEGYLDESGWFYSDFHNEKSVVDCLKGLKAKEIESVIAEIDNIGEVFVYTIDTALGAFDKKKIVVAVTPAKGHQVDPEAVFKECAKKLDSSSIPSYLQIFEKMPIAFVQSQPGIAYERGEANHSIICKFNDFFEGSNF